MARITALEPQQRDGERVNVHLDGAFAFGLAAVTAQQAGLYVGRELSPADVASLQDEDAFQKALNRALVFLGYRPRSENEVRRRLARAKVEPEVVDRVVARLRADSLVDDRDFAHYWVENRESFNPRGTRMLAMELRQKGIEREAVEEALAEVTDEGESAFAAGRRRLKQYAGLDYREFRTKMGNFLARRGFAYEAAREAVNRLWQESQGDLPEEAEE
ncbi:MAG: RecX family transcriptional regulator [Chloroflexota bacterium]